MLTIFIYATRKGEIVSENNWSVLRSRSFRDRFREIGDSVFQAVAANLEAIHRDRVQGAGVH